MKKILFLLLLAASAAFSQTNPNPFPNGIKTVKIDGYASGIIPINAGVTINSTTQAFRKPVMSTSQMNGIASPVTFSEVANSTTGTFWYYNGSDWIDSGINPTFQSIYNTSGGVIADGSDFMEVGPYGVHVSTSGGSLNTYQQGESFVVVNTDTNDGVNVSPNKIDVTNEGVIVSIINQSTAEYNANLPDGKTGDQTFAFLSDVPSPITIDSTPTDGSANAVSSNGVFDALATKQNSLVSGTNIKTVNSTTLLGSGDLPVEPVLSGTGYLKKSGTTPSYVTQIPLTTDVTGVLPIANGGTGSATKNFVDLTTTQTIAGAKTFSTIPVVGTAANSDNSTSAASTAWSKNTMEFMFFDNQTKSANITGFITPTIIQVISIPANSFRVGSRLEISQAFDKPNTDGTVTVDWYVNTANTLNGSELRIATYSIAAAARAINVIRTGVTIDGGNLINMGLTANVSTITNAGANNSNSTVAFDPTVQYYILQVVTPSSATNSLFQKFSYIKLKY